MSEAYIVDGVRTAIGSFGGSLAEVRPDDLAALTIRRLLERHPSLDKARKDLQRQLGANDQRAVHRPNRQSGPGRTEARSTPTRRQPSPANGIGADCSRATVTSVGALSRPTSLCSERG